MSIKLGQLVINSKNPKLLGTFFSEIFEESLVEKQNAYHLKNISQYPFLFSNKVKSSGKPGDEFYIYLENEMSLEELQQKIKFFCYRNQVKNSLFKVKNKENELEVLDLDGRRWVFKLH